MLLLRPLMIDDIPITVATPMMTPSVVRNDLSLFWARESTASRRISLIPQRLDRIEIRRLRCGIDPEKQSSAGRHAETQRDRPPLDRRGQRRLPCDDETGRVTQNDPD